LRDINAIIVHHTATPEEGWTLERVRSFHVEDRGWAEVGYHYVIETSPVLTLRVGRRADKMGAHARGANQGTLAISVIGNYASEEIRGEVLCFLSAAIADLCISYGVSVDNVRGHSEVTPPGYTLCPGFSMTKVRARVTEILSR